MWNYRIVEYLDGSGFGLHEVFYDADGNPWCMTEGPARFVCDRDDGPKGIHESMMRARRDAIGRPVFKEPEPNKWPGKAPEFESSNT